MPDPDFDIGGKALLKRYNSVPAPDPDLEIRGRGGGGGGQEAVCKNTFSALGASVWSQNQEGGGGEDELPEPLPWIRHYILNRRNLRYPSN